MTARRSLLGLALVMAATGGAFAAEKKAAKLTFQRTQLDSKFRSEGVAAGDFNHDGKLDVAAGSVYYAAPDWQMHAIREKADEYDPAVYSDSFCNFAEDVNGDGWTDLLVVDFPGKETWWFENPQTAAGPWKRHACVPETNNESPQYLDVDGDGQRDLLYGAGEKVGFATRTKDVAAPWTIRTISQAKSPGTNRFSHGLGLGDVNGDGRHDVLVPEGWWEAPAKADQSEWAFHDLPHKQPCAHMFAYDFDGDKDHDILCSSAHAFGVWWLEQQEPGTFKLHEIDMSFSQTHSMCLADMNGDGLADFVTGKRWWAHGAKGDPGSDQPAVLYWFELSRQEGKPVWTRHDIDNNSGVGTQFEVTDMNGDGLLDVITANKKGAHLFVQARE